MEKYLYFRVGTATASEDDEATGTNLYPVSHIMGALSGTSDADGAITFPIAGFCSSGIFAILGI